MKKAQNQVEVTGILVVVVAVSLVVWPIINSQKTKLMEVASVKVPNSFNYSKTKNKITALADSMGLPVENNTDMASLLDQINNQISQLSSSGPSYEEQAAQCQSAYAEIINDLAKSPAANSTEINSKAFDLAKSMGIHMDSNAPLGEVLKAINSQMHQLFTSAGTSGEKWSELGAFNSQYKAIISDITANVTKDNYTTVIADTSGTSSPVASTPKIATGKIASGVTFREPTGAPISVSVGSVLRDPTGAPVSIPSNGVVILSNGGYVTAADGSIKSIPAGSSITVLSLAEQQAQEKAREQAEAKTIAAANGRKAQAKLDAYYIRSSSSSSGDKVEEVTGGQALELDDTTGTTSDNSTNNNPINNKTKQAKQKSFR